MVTRIAVTGDNTPQMRVWMRSCILIIKAKLPQINARFRMVGKFVYPYDICELEWDLNAESDSMSESKSDSETKSGSDTQCTIRVL